MRETNEGSSSMQELDQDNETLRVSTPASRQRDVPSDDSSHVLLRRTAALLLRGLRALSRLVKTSLTRHWPSLITSHCV